MGLLIWGCASMSQMKDFTFNPTTDETFPEAEEARLYQSGLGQPHRVIGEVLIVGRLGEEKDSLEKRLLEAVRQIGAQGVIVVEAGETVLEVGRAGVRHDVSGGAATDYRIYPAPVTIEEERIYIRGMAIRFEGA